jgi:hypothetical protein
MGDGKLSQVACRHDALRATFNFQLSTFNYFFVFHIFADVFVDLFMPWRGRLYGAVCGFGAAVLPGLLLLHALSYLPSGKAQEPRENHAPHVGRNEHDEEYYQ